MSYENPITVVDTESAKIRAAGMASFGQSVGGAITALGQRQRQEAKERKKENKAFLNAQTEYNAEYQQKSWMASDDFKEDAGFDISPQVTETFNKWADEGARLKAERDRSDDPEERRKLGAQIAVYDKFFLGGGMTNNLESFAELQKTIQSTGGVGKLGTIGGLSGSATDTQVFKDFMGMGRGNGGGEIKIKGLGGVIGENGQYSPLSLFASFDGREDGYDMSDLNNSLIIIPDMQQGTNDVLKKSAYLTDKGALNSGAEGFANLIKRDKNGKAESSSVYDANGTEFKYERLDFDKLKNSLAPTFDATIVGYTNEGGNENGDPSLGLKTMQSYIDDELVDMSDSDKEKFFELTGVKPEDISLEIGQEDGTILNKESLETYKNALTAQKYIELQNQMPRTQALKKEKLRPSDIKALETQKEQLELDQKLAGVIDTVIQSDKDPDLAMYEYMTDPINAQNLDYGVFGRKNFEKDLIPITQYKEWVSTRDAETFKDLFPNEKQNNLDFIDDEITKNPDSNFISINEERPLEFLDPESAYRIMIQTVPAFADMKTSELGTARGEGDMRERDRKKSPEYKAQQVKKFETMTYEWDGNTYTGEEAYIKKEQREPSYTGSSKSNLQLRQEYQRKLQDLKK
mgnify:CR=1 FL=1